MLSLYRMQHRASTGIMPKQLYILLSFITESDITEIHLNFVAISDDCMNHDTVTVHRFQRKLILFLKRALSSFPVKITYFFDGAASQHKNRKNLSTYAVTKVILEFLQNGTSQQHHMEKVHVMNLVAL